MSHKIQLAIQVPMADDPFILGQVSELDEIFVLEYNKGSKLPPCIDRPTHRYGTKAQKHGISAFQMNISALKSLADCTVKDINASDETEKNFTTLTR